MRKHQIPTMPSTKKVLIIEDEGEMCLLLNIILDRKGIQLDHVRDLQKAAGYLAKQQPDLILLDNKLPDGFGVDFLTYLKANYPNVRVIMISGFGAAKDVAIQNGADAFVEKPFTKEQLFKSIQHLLN